MTYPWSSKLAKHLTGFSIQHPIIHNTHHTHTPPPYTAINNNMPNLRATLVNSHPHKSSSANNLQVSSTTMHVPLTTPCKPQSAPSPPQYPPAPGGTSNYASTSSSNTQQLIPTLASNKNLPKCTSGYIQMIPTSMKKITLQELRLFLLNRQTKASYQSWRPTASTQCTGPRQQKDNRRSNVLPPRIRNQIRFYRYKRWCSRALHITWNRPQTRTTYNSIRQQFFWWNHHQHRRTTQMQIHGHAILLDSW